MENQEKRYRLRVNPKDNTITIKRVKESWNREEVEKLIMKYALEEHDVVISPALGEWLKQNL